MIDALGQLLQPAMLLYQQLFLMIVEVSGSWGWSIILLACLVTLMTMPLSACGRSLIRRVHEYETVLQPQIDRIKAESSGHEQHRRLAALYQRYDCSPFMGLLKTVPLLIQLPILFFTYYMFAAVDGFSQSGFLLIENLAEPDGLHAGLNLLPVLMTVVNILAVLTTRGFKRSDFQQGAILALLFLVVLYDYSAALLLFWTTNNFLTLISNLLALLSEDKQRGNHENRQAVLQALKVWLSHSLFQSVSSWLYVLTLVTWVRPEDTAADKLLTISLVLVLPLWHQQLLIKCATARQVQLKWMLSVQLLLLLAAGITASEILLHIYLLLFLLTLGVSWRTVVTQVRTALSAAGKPSNLSDSDLFYMAAGYVLVGTFLLFIHTPLVLFLSEPSAFYGMSVNGLLAESLPLILMSTVICLALLKISSGFWRYALFKVSAVSALLIFSYTQLIVPDYGLMSDLQFHTPETLVQNPYISVFEIVLLFTLTGLFFRIWQNTQLSHGRVTVAMLVISSAVLLWQVMSLNQRDNSEQMISQSAERFELKLAKVQNNVLIVLLDGFSAGKLPQLLEQNPQLYHALRDFTWYPDTLAAHGGTAGAMPALLGGHRFMADRLAKQQTADAESIYRQAYAVLPDNFIKAGYGVLWVADQQWLPPFDVSLPYGEAFKPYHHAPGVDENTLPQMVADGYRKLLMLSMFKAAPLFLKDKLYDDGQWFLEHSHISAAGFAVKSAQFSLLERLAAQPVGESPQPMFNFLHLEIPHSPFVMAENGSRSIAVKGSFEAESYHVLKKLAAVFERMRQDDVYDSTQIVLVSDHGWWTDNPMFDDAFKDELGAGYQNRRTPGFLHALLMVKPAGQSQQVMKKSAGLMSNADLPMMVCVQIEGCEGVETDLPDTDQRQLSYSISDRWEQDDGAHIQDTLKEIWSVEGSIFDQRNWKQLQ